MNRAFCFASGCCGLLAAAFLLTTRLAGADEVQMQNGDRYNGKVLSLNDDSLVLQNEVLGRIKLPRAKIAAISFISGAQKSGAVPQLTDGLPGAAATRPTDPALANLASHSNLIQMVQRQFLSGADSGAQSKFDDLVSGLLSGRLTVEDIRREAKTAADQVRSMKKDLGQDAGFALDGYLAILDQFLKEAPASQATANSNAPPRKKISDEQDDEL